MPSVDGPRPRAYGRENDEGDGGYSSVPAAGAGVGNDWSDARLAGLVLPVTSQPLAPTPELRLVDLASFVLAA